MDENRIDKDLKQSLDSFPYPLEFDRDDFRYHPEIIRDDRLEFSKNNFKECPDDIITKDIYICSSYDNYKIRLHIYQHKVVEKENVILYFHGGGYVFGVPEQVDDLMFKLARDLKATIISVDYRLAPQYPFPIPILDGYDALKWVISEGEKELGINSEAIKVFGGSAGAHLGAAIVQMAADNKIDNIKHQFLLYPVITNRMDSPSMVEFADSPLWNTFYADAAWIHFYGEDYKTKSDRYADLLNYDAFLSLPKSTIVACELDPLRDEGIAYAQELFRAGVPTELWVVPGAVHVFDLFACPLSDKFYDFLIDRMIDK